MVKGTNRASDDITHVTGVEKQSLLAWINCVCLCQTESCRETDFRKAALSQNPIFVDVGRAFVLHETEDFEVKKKIVAMINLQFSAGESPTRKCDTRAWTSFGRVISHEKKREYFMQLLTPADKRLSSMVFWPR